MGLLLTGIVIPSYAIDFNENALKHIPDRFIVVLKDDVKPDEFLKIPGFIGREEHILELLKHYAPKEVL